MRKVAKFYERFPYPQLPIKTGKDVHGKLHKTVMQRILASANLAAGDLKGKRVLEAGCGTGEKTIYFSLHGANATGIDISENSLGIARKTARKLGAKCKFKKLDIFAIPEKWDGKFDHVFSIGVIHHTKNPEKAVERLSKLVKEGGTLTLGLYNFYGRAHLRIRRGWLKFITGHDTEKGLEYIQKKILGRKFKSDAEKAYLADTFLHPCETYHTIGEAKGWFRQNGLEFIGVMPRVGKAELLAQIGWMLKRRGFFCISARRGKIVRK